MPYKGDTIKGTKACHHHILYEYSPIFVKMTVEQLLQVVEIHWEHSSFTDPGGDWNKVRCLDKNGTICFYGEEEGY